MNTRGLTELIVLNIGLDLGVISHHALHDARRDGARDDVHGRPRPAARRPAAASSPSRSRRSCARAPRATGELKVPAKSILVAPQDPSEPRRAARARRAARQVEPPREIIIAQVIVPERFVTGVLRDADDVTKTTEELNIRRDALVARGVAARGGRLHLDPARARTTSGSPRSRRST